MLPRRSWREDRGWCSLGWRPRRRPQRRRGEGRRWRSSTHVWCCGPRHLWLGRVHAIGTARVATFDRASESLAARGTGTSTLTLRILAASAALNRFVQAASLHLQPVRLAALCARH